MLIDAKRRSLYLGGVRSSRTDAVAGSLITYDIALEANPEGRVSEGEARALLHAWWDQRQAPGVWPLGRELDRLDWSLAPRQLGLEDLVPPSGDVPTAVTDHPVDGQPAWVGSAHTGVAALISRAMLGTGPPVAYFRAMSPELASETFLDSGAVLIVDGDAEVHPRKKAPVPLPAPRPAAVPRRVRLSPLLLVLVALTLTAAVLLALL
jgi:hypothetical protein